MTGMVAVGSADTGVGDGGHSLGLEVDAGAGNDSCQQSRGMEVVATVGLGISRGAGDGQPLPSSMLAGVTQLSMLRLLVPAVVVNALGVARGHHRWGWRAVTTVNARARGRLDTDAGGGSAIVLNTRARKKTEKKNLLDGSVG